MLEVPPSLLLCFETFLTIRKFPSAYYLYMLFLVCVFYCAVEVIELDRDGFFKVLDTYLSPSGDECTGFWGITVGYAPLLLVCIQLT